MTAEPCMCGDLECPFCGPAQGYHRCPQCRSVDPCDCPDEDDRDPPDAWERAHEEWAKHGGES